MIKHNIWHKEYIEIIILTRQIYIELYKFVYDISKTANEAKIPITVTKVVSYLQKQISL